MFWESEHVKGVTMWGYVRGAHWRTNQGAWLMYPNGAERPALQWLVRYVENDARRGDARAVVQRETRTSPPGSTIGTVVATDADPDTTFSQWQLTDPSGNVRDRCQHGHDQPRGGCDARLRGGHELHGRRLGLRRLPAQRPQRTWRSPSPT